MKPLVYHLNSDEKKLGTAAELSVLANSATPASINQVLQNTTPGDSHRLSTRLSKDHSRQLVAAASKHRGLSVTTAVQSALILAAQPYLDPADGRLICFKAFSVRDLVPAAKNRPKGASVPDRLTL